jgi:hypothetical protein
MAQRGNILGGEPKALSVIAPNAMMIITIEYQTNRTGEIA